MRDLDILIREKEAAGWMVTPTKSGHLEWRAPNSGNTVISGSTPSDHRALENLKSRLRAAELAVAESEPETSSVTPSPPQPHVVEQAPGLSPEAAELKQLIREAHEVLGDLRRERKLSEELLPEIVYTELVKPDGQLYELVKQAVTGFDANGKKSIEEYAAAMGMLLKTAEKEISKRTARLDELITRTEFSGL